MKSFETKEAFLLDALDYYTADVSRRNINSNECKYAPLNSNSEGCLIGRCLPKKDAQLLDTCFDGSIATIARGSEKRRIPQWMLNFGIEFLRDCQMLHDENYHWNSSGLNKAGRQRLKALTEIHSLDQSQFAKYITP